MHDQNRELDDALDRDALRESISDCHDRGFDDARDMFAEREAQRQELEHLWRSPFSIRFEG
jgi:hypothetical protein